METVRMGVVGIGAMGSAHAAHIFQGDVEGMRLAAVCDSSPERREWAKKQFPGVPVFSDEKELLSSGLVDAILIAVPHPLHPAIAVEAFHRGIHVLSEKPEGIDVLTARKENQEAKKSGVVFGIMYNQRTNPLFQKLRDTVRSGRLGELQRFSWTVTNWYRTQAYYDSGTWRADWKGEGGGVLMNQCPHNLDLWQWIAGMPDQILASCREAQYHNISVEDDAVIFGRYHNGGTALFVTSTGEYPGTNRLEYAGTRGKAVIENGVLTLSLLKEDIRTVTKTSGEAMPELPVETVRIAQTEPEPGHLGILRDFSRAVRTGSPLLAPGEEGILGLSIANAAYLSGWTGNWVDLPLDGEAYLAALQKKQSEEAERKKDTSPHHPGDPSGRYEKRWRVLW